ncbi:prenyltransferase/squalene oxidase repeat-containing protein [Streptomyces tsukubensis]|uniref:Squalene cyclase C-terminal domain-containing protein n=1 Tax=Streptomyces tsukubensis TaxID=83656 RepID=A0A1V4A6Q0_9ACTN|nr:prenyltransferase/squalene oxidase repeat-containing protein [Streptomyces tsukubensis]OON76701.1 hypothetical protein B1H18_20525 [Streptomyces tsukubensis]QFR93330.1 hypothetical protein GBW32_09825 [Streptomyces tsukubensis]
MNVSRSALSVAAAVVLCAASAPAAVAAPSPTPSAKAPAALYGEQDPTYDGVWRQSLALVALDAAGVRPATSAVGWLTEQSCDNGAYAPYRANTSGDCGPKERVQSDVTGAAVQALAAVGGHRAEIDKSVAWLKSTQNKDGGWGLNPGLPSDANSTATVIGALAAAGQKPAEVTSGKDKSPYDALLAFALPCDKGEDKASRTGGTDKDPGGTDKGAAFAYQPDKKGELAANADATAAATTAGFGQGFVVSPAKKAMSGTECAKPGSAREAAHNGALYLSGALAKDGHLMSSMPGAEAQPDIGNTADAVVALGAAGLTDKSAKPVAWLKKNGEKWADQAGPAAWSELVLAARASGADPRDFGGTDLVAALKATGPAPEAKADTSADSDKDKKDDKGGGANVWWMIVVGLAAGAGIGFLLSSRNKNKPRL